MRTVRKAFVLAPGENWIVDRFVAEWNADNPDISVATPLEADVVWLLADWAWSRVSTQLLATRKVIVTVHHVVPQKFGLQQHREFDLRDRFTTAYTVPNEHTAAFVRGLTTRPVHVIPYWANQRAFRPSPLSREALRTKHRLPVDGYLVGSFQRDTEGHDLVSPKLEKGPDLLCDYLEGLQAHVTGPLHVVLAGWRRQYVMCRLVAAGIRFTCFERPPTETLSELYRCLDLYPVTSRFEGGPQSLIECGLLGVPVISRDAGMANQLLPPSAIHDDVSLASPAIPKVDHLLLPTGYAPYRALIEAV